MCEFLDKVENKGVEKGLNEGRQEAKQEIALTLKGMGMSVETIAEAVKVSVETVQQRLAPGRHRPPA